MTFKTNVTIRDLLDAGVHFGHRRNFWNPKVAKYIYGVRNGIHIIDLDQTIKMLNSAMHAMRDVAAKNGRILFVGTKRQASDLVEAAASKCGQYFVNSRWLGGMLTNWSTISASIKTLQRYEELAANPEVTLTKKERLDLDRKRQKLHLVLGGIRNLGGKPDMLFVIDTNTEHLAISEAKKLGIPIVAIVDTNSNPDNVDYIIPGNDDARKAIELYMNAAADAILDGIQDSLTSSGIDLGAMDIIGLGEAGSDIQIEDKDAEEAPANKKRGAAVVKKPSKKTKKAETEAGASEQAAQENVA